MIRAVNALICRLYRVLPAALIVLSACAVQERKPPRRVDEAPATPPPEAAKPAAAAKPEHYQGDLKPFIVEARASSEDKPEYCAQLAFDGRNDTRWSSAFTNDQWIEGLFDRPVGLEEITIRWETARASDFSILVLNRQGHWVEVAHRDHAMGLEDHLSFPMPFAALGLRVLCQRRATEWGNSIFEIDLTGTTEGTPPMNNLLGFKVKPTPWQEWERGNAEKLLAEAAADPKTSANLSDDELLDRIEKRSFDYFWYETHPTNGLTKDRARNFMSSEEINIASVAAVGFGLTAYPIGAERGWVARTEAVERVRITLRNFADGPMANRNGFFPHFVNLFSCEEANNTEISTIDTALFLAGMIVSMEYFQDPEIDRLSKLIFERVDWNWARNGDPNFVTHGCDLNGHFFNAKWGSTTEGLLIYLLALGSPTHPLQASSWNAVDHHTEEYEGYRFVVEYGFQSMFRFQYPALWYDFRGKTDRAGVDYFENGTTAALAMRQYCIQQAPRFLGSYGSDLWGLGAADGPGDRYMIYGFPPGEPYSPTDGTIVPYAIAGSLPFVPQHALRALRKLYDDHHEAWGKYGFADSVNPLQSFVTRDAIGLDAGTILLGIENYRSRFVWRLFMRNSWIQETTRKIAWTQRPLPTDSNGPVDLARQARWKLTTGGGILSSPALDDSGWISVVVPDRIENASPELANFDGTAWYRAEFTIEAARLSNWIRGNRPLALTLGAVDDTDAAYVNGVKVGETLPAPGVEKKTRRYRVAPALLRTGRNVIAIQVTDRGGRGGIWNMPVTLGPE